MTPLFNEADQNLLRTIPNETRRAVVELAGRSWKQGVLDTADNIRTATKKALVDDPELAAFMSTFADTITKGAGITELPTFDVPTPDPTTLSDAEILDLPPLDRARVLTDLAKTGHHLIAAIIDVGVPCTNEMCLDGRVRISGDVVVDCHVCDGVGSIDGRRRCADRECLSYDEPLVYSLAGGWECSRKHGHAERERASADRFVTPADLADVVKMDPAPATDPDAFPWDAPSPEAEAARNALDRGHTPGHE